MGMEYELVTTQNPITVVAILENDWIGAINSKEIAGVPVPETLLRCTILHGYGEQGYGGFSFCDPIAPVGWHEIIQVIPLWNGEGNPYTYVLSNCDSSTFHGFLTITNAILEMHGIAYEFHEL